MNTRQRQDLDNYITGHYGEDQFREQSDCWPELTAHQEHWERHNNSYVYEYDPTDEGPEQSVARIILSTHTPEEMRMEQMLTIIRKFKDPRI